MEFGDIVYFILMLVFVVFGIFNDSKRKKKKMDSSTSPVNPEIDRDLRDVFREVFQNPERQQFPPPVPTTLVKKKTPQAVMPTVTPIRKARPEFQSSMDLVTNFEGESSLKGAIFASEVFEKQMEVKSWDVMHPVLDQLRSGEGRSEIRKAVIYSEILKRKYQ